MREKEEKKRGQRKEERTHTGARTAEHEYHGHLFFLEYGLVGGGDVQCVSDLLYEVGCHRGLDPDQESARARRADGRSGGVVRMRERWPRGGVRECSTRRRKRERLRRREPGLVRLWDGEEPS